MAEISKNQDPKLTNNLTTKLSEIQQLRAELNKIYLSYEAYKTYFLEKGLTTEQIDAIFKPEYKIPNPSVDNTEEPKVYQYYGKNLILGEFKLTNDKKTNKILKTILSQKSEAYLADVIIPQENQEFSFYTNKYKSDREKFKAIPKDENSKFMTSERKYKFRSEL